jgi:hypothetical protein
MSILEENEFARLIDDGQFYILEDKTQLHRQIVLQKSTETWKNIWLDLAETDSGTLVAVRYYFPKNQFELAVARNAFNTLTSARSKELKRLKELYGGVEIELWRGET